MPRLTHSARDTALAREYWRLNRLTLRAGARTLARRIQHQPRVPGWSLPYEGFVEMLTLGTPNHDLYDTQKVRGPLLRARNDRRAARVSEQSNKRGSMASNNRRTVFSTDPEPETPKQAPALPVNPAAPLPTRQRNQPVIVGIERKGRGGKIVSVITGVMSPPAGKDALLKLLKTSLGAGGTVKEEAIEIQGDHRDQIVAILVELGYKAKRSGG